MNKNTLLVAGLIVGFITGFGISFFMSQPQITQLQSTLSDTQSDLSASQSEVQSLQSQLADAQTDVASLETQLVASQATVTSLEEQLAAKEADYSTLSEEYDEFKSDVISLIDSLEKKMDLEAQIIIMWVHYERLESPEFTSTLLGLGPYVNATGDSELITIWNDLWAHLNAAEYTQADAGLADLMERNFALIQSDLSELNTLLSG